MGVFEICFWYESTSHKPGDAHSSSSRHADVSSYRSSYHITICILKMTAMIQSQRCWDSHHHCSQPLINSLIRNSLLPYFVSFFGSETSQVHFQIFGSKFKKIDFVQRCQWPSGVKTTVVANFACAYQSSQLHFHPTDQQWHPRSMTSGGVTPGFRFDRCQSWICGYSLAFKET